MEEHSNHEQNSNEHKEISKSLKRFFGVGDFGFNFMTNIETYYFQFFLTDIAKFTIPIVTLIATLTSLVDAALSWVYGVLLNTMKPMKWGRYRSWLVVIPWLVPFLYAFQFIKLIDGVAGIVIIIVATITSHIAWNIPFVANISMINIASKTPEDRMALSSTRALWGALGMVLYSYVGPGVVSILAAVVGAKNSYGAAAFVFGAVMAAGYFAHFKMFEGYEESGTEEFARLQREKKAKQDQHTAKGHGMLKSLAANPYLLGLIVADLAKYVYMFVASGIAVYYFTVMLVSHDRQFVDNTVTECWIFEGGGRIGQYVGGYHDARGQQAQSLAQKQTVVKKTTEVAQPKAETVKRGGNKLSYNLQRELEQLPQKLEALEAELQTLQDQVADPDFFGQPHHQKSGFRAYQNRNGCN